MTEKGRSTQKLLMQARLRAAAEREVVRVVANHSTLRGEQAQQLARRAVRAALPNLRAEYANQMAQASNTELVTTACAGLLATGMNLAALVVLFTRCGRPGKTMAAASMATNLILLGYDKSKEIRVRRAAVHLATTGPGRAA